MAFIKDAFNGVLSLFRLFDASIGFVIGQTVLGFSKLVKFLEKLQGVIPKAIISDESFKNLKRSRLEIELMARKLLIDADKGFRKVQLTTSGLVDLFREATSEAKKTAEEVKKVLKVDDDKDKKIIDKKALEKAAQERESLRDAAFQLQNDLELMTRKGRDKELAELIIFETEKRAILLAGGEENFDTLDAIVRERGEAINEKFIKLEREKSDAAMAIRREFDLMGMSATEQELARLESDLQRKNVILRAGGEREIDIAAEVADRRGEIEEQAAKDRISGALRTTQAILSNFKQAFSGMRVFAKLQRGLALGEAMIQGALGVQKALGAAPPPFNFILAAAVGAAAAANIATIASQKLARGGVVTGGQRTGDTVPVLADRGEMFLSMGQQRNLLNMINSGGGGGSQVSFGDININVTGNADGIAVGETVARTIQEKLRTLAKDNRRARGLQLRPV